MSYGYLPPQPLKPKSRPMLRLFAGSRAKTGPVSRVQQSLTGYSTTVTVGPHRAWASAVCPGSANIRTGSERAMVRAMPAISPCTSASREPQPSVRSQGQDMTQQEWSSHSAGAVYFSSVPAAARARPPRRVAAVAESAAAPKPRRVIDGRFMT